LRSLSYWHFRGGIGKLNKQLFRSFFFWMFGDAGKSKNEITRTETISAVEEILFGMECYKKKYELPPRVLTDLEFASITIPTVIMIGKNEQAFSAKKVINRIKRVAPEINTCLLPKAGHDLLLSQTEKVNEEVLLFLTENNRVTSGGHR
jgi:pimeloyl-ACP methyl ester carboxylesterase